MLLLGAGATFAETEHKNEYGPKPPLDSGFFSKNSNNDNTLSTIKEYFLDEYGIDITESKNNSLERVMTTLYNDVIFSDNSKKDSSQKNKSKMFANLVDFLNQEIASTTNKIIIDSSLILYKLIRYYLRSGIKPQNFTIITFNYDLLVEKILDYINQKKDFLGSGTIFSFPSCYSVDLISNSSFNSKDKFSISRSKEGIKVLKLHGSLNWYSTHKTRNPSPSQMFKRTRAVRIDSEKEIQVYRLLDGKKDYMLPVIIPPINSKSLILPKAIAPIWKNAESALREADIVTIYGYSCPEMDFESSSMIRRCLNECSSKQISIIDNRS